MDEILKEIAEFVNGCLGPLSGTGDITSWLRDVAIQLIGTIILFFIVKIFLWKPITKFLEARKEIMDKEMEDASKHREQAVLLEEELNAKYSAAKTEIAELLKNAEKQGNLRKEEIIAEAKREAERRINLAHEEIEAEIALKQNEIKNQIVSVAFVAAEKIIGREINQEEYLQVVSNIIDSGAGND